MKRSGKIGKREIPFEIHGNDMQHLELVLPHRARVRAESGSLFFYQNGIEMNTNLGSGILEGIKRKIARENFFITEFKNMHPDDLPQKVAFAAPFPGEIFHVEVAEYKPIICQKGAYMCSVGDIEFDIRFNKRLGAGFFGGEGFVFQELKGQGDVFLHAGGKVVVLDLEQDEILRVDTGAVVAFSQSVRFDIETIRGIRNMVFGGEGLFLTTLQGPGRVYLQNMPFPRIAASVMEAFPEDVRSRMEGRQ